MKRLAQTISELRQANSLSRAECAKAARISREHLWHIETGRTMPGPCTLVKIAAALGVGPQRLLSNQDVLLEDRFISAIKPHVRRLSEGQRQHVLKMLEAAPKNGRPL